VRVLSSVQPPTGTAPQNLQMGQVRRTINLICALALTAVSAYAAFYLIFFADRFKVGWLVGAGAFTFVGLYWLYADFVNADPRPER
jgi:hypothetical protein